MKYIKLLLIAGAVFATASCNKDPLDLGPIDYYGSENFWTSESQVDGYMDGLHSNMRDVAWTHTITFGELRGGHYKPGVSSDGSTVSDGDICEQNFDADHTGVSTFGGYYGKITNVNLFIARVEKMDDKILPTAKKNYYLGIAHGLRAFYYFDLYRIYGTVPLRLDVAVIDGEINPINLYMKRSSGSKVMAQIKSDLWASLKYFGDVKDFNPYGHGAKAYWSKAATEYLAGEVYLWNAKVKVDDQVAVTTDIDSAKVFFENVTKNYGLSLQNNFADVFSTTNKGNSEIIFAIRYVENEATNSNGNFTYISDGRGVAPTQLNDKGETFGDPLNLKGAGMQRYQYIDNIFLAYDLEDARRNATFVASYDRDIFQATGELVLQGTYVGKNNGHVNSANVRVFDGDYVYYRLSGAYLALAEIANFKGTSGEVKKNIDIVRKRAYGSNWGDGSMYGYTEGSFTTNELAILAEKDKEFVQEGQRWWDLNRMTLTKGGKHLVFCEEGNANKNGKPVLKESEAYKVFWPLDKTILGNDPELEQTPGYSK